MFNYLAVLFIVTLYTRNIFCKKEMQITNQKEFRFEKVIKGRGSNIYVK